MAKVFSMYREMTKSERINLFVAFCEEAQDLGTEFILTHVFWGVSARAGETINQEVDRKYGALTGFAESVYRALGGQSSQIGKLGPRQYVEMIRDMSSAEKALRNKVYAAFMEAGHHIRGLTNHPDYILPGETVPQGQKADLRAIAA